jgi:GntR family transcriptional regulator
MDTNWNDSLPIYRQLRDRVVAMILEGVLNDGDPLPSVRSVAAEYRLNPLTVLKGYQQLVDENLVEKRRGRGMFVTEGARRALLKDELVNYAHQPGIFRRKDYPPDIFFALSQVFLQIGVGGKKPDIEEGGLSQGPLDEAELGGLKPARRDEVIPELLRELFVVKGIFRCEIRHQSGDYVAGAVPRPP